MARDADMSERFICSVVRYGPTTYQDVRPLQHPDHIFIVGQRIRLTGEPGGVMAHAGTLLEEFRKDPEGHTREMKRMVDLQLENCLRAQNWDKHP